MTIADLCIEYFLYLQLHIFLGFDLKLYTISTRIQFLFALLFGVVLYAAMNAVLFSQMAIFETVFPFSTLEDIAEKKTHSLCVRTDSFVYNYFTVSISNCGAQDNVYPGKENKS